MKSIYILLTAVLALLIVWHIRGRFTSSIEQPTTKPVKTSGNIRIVEMPPQIIATVRTKGTLASAPGQAFSSLAGYIFGDNRSTDKIAMTAPVTSQAVDGNSDRPANQGTKIAMTAPVTRTEVADGTFETAFIMPAKRTMETLPVPNNDAISIKETTPSRKAVRTFGGYATQAHIEKERAAFQEALNDQAIERTGSPTLAQYNDPWTPPRMRKNELWVDLTENM